MATLTRTTDDKARVSLPRSFANATVLIQEISETELLIRKAQVIPEEEIGYAEDTQTTLTERDRDRFLALLDEPPAPSPALKKAVAKRRRRRG
jgi:hypothetical protein